MLLNDIVIKWFHLKTITSRRRPASRDVGFSLAFRIFSTSPLGVDPKPARSRFTRSLFYKETRPKPG